MIECLIQDEPSVIFLVVTCMILTVFLVIGLAKVCSRYHDYLQDKSSGYVRFCKRSRKIGAGAMQYGVGYPLVIAIMGAGLCAVLAVLYHYGLGLWHVAKCLWES